MLEEFTEPIMLEDRQSTYWRNVGGVQENNWRMPSLCGVRMAGHAPYYLIDRRSALIYHVKNKCFNNGSGDELCKHKGCGGRNSTDHHRL